MAADNDEPERQDGAKPADDVSSPSGSGTDSDSDADSDSGSANQIEWLATGRAKRATAGNRMKGMLANEEPAAEDSDLELLFAEDDDDAGFTDEDKDAGSDVQMDSSSDEEDDGKDDDEEGEKELQRQAREKKAAQRKRKAEEAIPMKFRKKVRIDKPPAAAAAEAGATTTAETTPAPRPKKKSERASWLPSPSDAPTRASERATTKSSKQQLHQQMMERERRRKKQMETMEKKAKKAAALKKPPMTQAQRLAEAAVVEKRNAKSLNRWEEAEKQREEERQAKLAAMYNRTLEGPVVTFWSGVVELREDQLKNLGKMVTMEEKAPRKKRQSAAALLAAQQEAEKAKEGSSVDGSPTVESPTTDQKTEGESGQQSSMEATPQPVPSPAPSEAKPGLAAPNMHVTNAIFMPIEEPLEPATAPTPVSGQTTPPVSGQTTPSATGLAAPASMLAPPRPAPSPSATTSVPMGLQKPNTPAPLHTPHRPSPLSLPPQTPADPIPPTATAPPPPPPIPRITPTPQPPSQVPTPESTGHPPQPNTPTEPASSLDGRITRSCIILQNFDNNAIKDKHVQTQILFGRKMNRIGRPAQHPVCAITGQQARYRDPGTGLPYYNAYAYKELKKLDRGEYNWSRLVGAWMGTGKTAARGVPDCFLTGQPPPKAKEEAEGKPAEGQAAGEGVEKAEGEKAPLGSEQVGAQPQPPDVAVQGQQQPIQV